MIVQTKSNEGGFET